VATYREIDSGYFGDVNGSFYWAAQLEVPDFTESEFAYGAPAGPTLSIFGDVGAWDYNGPFANDVDVYRFEVLPDADDSVVLTFDIDYTTNGFDSQVQIFDANQNFLASNDDVEFVDVGSTGNRDSYFSYTTSEAGYYYVAVTSWNNDWRGGAPSGGGSTGDYVLHISVTGADGIQIYGDGGFGNDAIYGDRNGDATADYLHGYAGADVMFGDQADDTLVGGDGSDTIYGGAGNDYLTGDEQAGDVDESGAGDADVLSGGAGTNYLQGGRGSDTADYTAIGVAVEVDLENVEYGEVGFGRGAGFYDYLYDIQNVIGGAGADTITGGGYPNVLQGGGGDDVINGGGYFLDTLLGGDGADTLTGGQGADVMDGGAGADNLVGGAGADSMNGGDGADVVTYKAATAAVGVFMGNAVFSYGDAAGDTFAGVETVIGSEFGDVVNASGNSARVLWGLGGDDILLGTLSNNILNGGDGADSMNGLAGVDRLRGGAGADTLDGGLGHDVLTGGASQDAFQFASALSKPRNMDTVSDFSVRDDTILLDNQVFATLAEGRLTNAAFHIGAAAGDGSDRIVYDAATGALYYDADGTGATAAITFAMLDPGLAMTRADFLVT
jgi:Ca2+-binding RTX toxin-like protein